MPSNITLLSQPHESHYPVPLSRVLGYNNSRGNAGGAYYHSVKDGSVSDAIPLAYTFVVKEKTDKGVFPIGQPYDTYEEAKEQYERNKKLNINLQLVAEGGEYLPRELLHEYYPFGTDDLHNNPDKQEQINKVRTAMYGNTPQSQLQAILDTLKPQKQTSKPRAKKKAAKQEIETDNNNKTEGGI